MLQKAIEIAEQALAGMTDQNGQPYIEHARRVMDAMDTEEEKIVAILHDVVEDTEMSLKDLMDEASAMRWWRLWISSPSART